MECEKHKTRVIAVVDDDPDYLLHQKLELEAAGYRVIEADNEKDALRMLETTQPDLMVVDLMMEHDDSGFTLCYYAKKRYPDLPVIMVTAVASETGIGFDASTDEERSWVKADAVLDKPVRFEQLEKEIARLLGE